MARRKRARRRRRNSRLGWLMIPIIALIVWWTITRYVFVVRNVEVKGAGNVSEQDVVRLSDLRFGAPLRSIDVSSLTTHIESDGRLALVGVETRYPNTVVLTVRERTRDALILQAGKVLLLDSDGYVAEVLDHLPEQSVPYVTGLRPSTFQLGRRLDVAEAKLHALKAVIEALKYSGTTAYVSELNVDNPDDLRIITRTGMTVLLGNADDMVNKIIWMGGAVRDLESRGQTNGRLDVSSGTKADYLPGPTPTPTPVPVPTETPEPEESAYEEAVIGNSAI